MPLFALCVNDLYKNCLYSLLFLQNNIKYHYNINKGMVYMQSYISNSEIDTMNLAKKIANKLTKGDIIVLTGDLGSGKTKFTQGFLSYFGLENEISSPTFTIVNEYNGANIPIYHFDVYRLSSSDEFYAIGGEQYFEEGICIIEWGEQIADVLPKDYLHITFERNDNNDTKRILKLEPHGKRFENIIKSLEF
jgi:tRNA threonylcarbamoyladenosine biosynthesis protein TsaE